MDKEIKAIMQAFKNQFTIIDQIENAKEIEFTIMEKQYSLQFGIVKSDLALFRILPDSKEEHELQYQIIQKLEEIVDSTMEQLGY